MSYDVDLFDHSQPGDSLRCQQTGVRSDSSLKLEAEMDTHHSLAESASTASIQYSNIGFKYTLFMIQCSREL